MQTLSVVPKPKRHCVLRSVVVGYRRLIQYESLMHVLGREPADDDPVTVTIEKAQRLSGLSRRTLDRMIAAGNAKMADAA